MPPPPSCCGDSNGGVPPFDGAQDMRAPTEAGGEPHPNVLGSISAIYGLLGLGRAFFSSTRSRSSTRVDLSPFCQPTHPRLPVLVSLVSYPPQCALATEGSQKPKLYESLQKSRFAAIAMLFLLGGAAECFLLPPDQLKNLCDKPNPSNPTQLSQLNPSPQTLLPQPPLNSPHICSSHSPFPC